MNAGFAFALSVASVLTGTGWARTPPAEPHRTYFVAPGGDDDGPGTTGRPWATLGHAAAVAVAGDTVLLHGGHYVLTAQVRPSNSGRHNAWITFVGYPGEEPILDAQSIRLPAHIEGRRNDGALQIEGVSYIRVANVTVVNSHDAGITVRDSSDVDLINNKVVGTFASGIAVWDSNRDDKGTRHVRVIGNSISKATSWDFAPADVPHRGEPPHEALSIGGAVDFVVAYNHVFDSDKEGIVVKETSKRGIVHHNHVEKLARQGIYVGSFFGEVNDIDVYDNVINDCRFAGFVLSVENGQPTERIGFHDNLVFNNGGSGVYFSRWGVENIRRHIQIYRNIFYHNGYGPPAPGQQFFWHTGGVYLYSTKIDDVSIRDNIFSDNKGFQIGYSELFLHDGRSWSAAATAHGIVIRHNLVSGDNPSAPIESGGDPIDQVKIYAVAGDLAVVEDPRFNDPASGDFTLKESSPAFRAHIFSKTRPPDVLSSRWWKDGFPPEMSKIILSR